MAKLLTVMRSALLLVAVLLCAGPALAHAGHYPHAVAMVASSGPATSHHTMPRHDTLPCCAGPSCADLVPLPAAGCPAEPQTRMGAGYPAAAAGPVNGFDPSPASPPPRSAS